MQIRQCNNQILQLNEHQIAQLEKYSDLLKKWNGLNLIARSTENDIFGWHINDALSIYNLVQDESGQIIDFGAGGGVLGICLSYMGKDVVLIERSITKANFLSDIMKFKSVYSSYEEFIMHELQKKIQLQSNNENDSRYENYAIKNAIEEHYIEENIIVIRGVSTIKNILNLLNNAKIYKLILLKSNDVMAEIEESLNEWSFEYEIYQRQARASGSIIMMQNINRKKIK